MDKDEIEDLDLEGNIKVIKYLLQNLKYPLLEEIILKFEMSSNDKIDILMTFIKEGQFPMLKCVKFQKEEYRFSSKNKLASFITKGKFKMPRFYNPNAIFFEKPENLKL